MSLFLLILLVTYTFLVRFSKLHFRYFRSFIERCYNISSSINILLICKRIGIKNLLIVQQIFHLCIYWNCFKPLIKIRKVKVGTHSIFVINNVKRGRHVLVLQILMFLQITANCETL